MSAAVRDLLSTFDALPLSERHEAAVEIIRRSSEGGELPEQALHEIADELFCELDEAEASDAAS